MRYYLIPARMAIIRKTKIHAGKNVEGRELYTVCENSKLV